jgi:hypothetical protein
MKETSVKKILLIECPACKEKVSQEASVCPKCGQPITNEIKEEAINKAIGDKKITKSGYFGCLTFIIVIFIIGSIVGQREGPKKSYDFADQYRPEASRKCSTAIEKMALYDYEWSSLSLEYIPRFPYASQTGDVITFRGSNKNNALKFKNAFGVMIPMRYECSYNIKTKSVVDIKVEQR